MSVSRLIVGRVLQSPRALWGSNGFGHRLCWNWIAWGHCFVGADGEVWSGQFCASRSTGKFIPSSTLHDIRNEIFSSFYVNRLRQQWFWFSTLTKRVRRSLSSVSFIRKSLAANMKTLWRSSEPFWLKELSMAVEETSRSACSLAQDTQTCRQLLEHSFSLSIGIGSHWHIACH